MSLEVKKPRTAQEVRRGSLFVWIKGVRGEFGKISWTSRAELRSYTKIVIGATFVMGLGIYFMDLLVRGMLNGLSGVMRLLFGG